MTMRTAVWLGAIAGAIAGAWVMTDAQTRGGGGAALPVPGRSAVASRDGIVAASLDETDPELAKALRASWGRPVRSLAFRNAAHQKERD